MRRWGALSSAWRNGTGDVGAHLYASRADADRALWWEALLLEPGGVNPAAPVELPYSLAMEIGRA